MIVLFVDVLEKREKEFFIGRILLTTRKVINATTIDVLIMDKG